MCGVADETDGALGEVGEWVVPQVEDGPDVEVGFAELEEADDVLAVAGEVAEGVFARGGAGEFGVVGPVVWRCVEGDDVEGFAVVYGEGEHVAAWTHLEEKRKSQYFPNTHAKDGDIYRVVVD